MNDHDPNSPEAVLQEHLQIGREKIQQDSQALLAEKKAKEEAEKALVQSYQQEILAKLPTFIHQWVRFCTKEFAPNFEDLFPRIEVPGCCPILAQIVSKPTAHPQNSTMLWIKNGVINYAIFNIRTSPDGRPELVINKMEFIEDIDRALALAQERQTEFENLLLKHQESQAVGTQQPTDDPILYAPLEKSSPDELINLGALRQFVIDVVRELE